MAVFTETIKLEDQVSPAAKKAASEAKTLGTSLDSVNKALVKAAALGDVKSFRSLTSQSKALGVALEQVDKGLLSEVKSAKLADVANAKLAKEKAKSAKEAEAANNKLTASNSSASASLAEMTGGLSLVVEAAAGVALALGAVVVAGAAMAIEAVEAKEKMVSLFDALGEGKVSGAETVAMLDKLGDSIGQTRKQLAPIAQAFLTMGVTGTAALESLTLAAASAGALAEGGAEKFTTMFGVINAAAETGSKLSIPFKKLEKQLQGVGLNIGDLATKMNMSEKALTDGLKAGTVDAKAFGDALQGAATDKGAGPLQKAGASLTNVWAKFQENIMKFFEDVPVGPFLDEVKKLFDIFSQAQPSGQALKAGIGGFFKEVFKQATAVVPLVKHFLLDLVIYGLKAYIALKPIVKTIKDFASSATGVAVIDGLVVALKAIGVVVLVVVAVIAALIVVLVAMSAAFGIVVGTVIDFVANISDTMLNWALGAVDVAENFVQGLVDGIVGGASAVIGAVKGLADSATGAFKSALGIASPSKVMMKLGGHTGGGFAEGLEDTAGDVHGAASGVADAAVKGASAPTAAPSGGGSGGGGGGASVVANFAAGAFVINGAGASAAEITEEMMSLAWERMAAEAGL